MPTKNKNSNAKIEPTKASESNKRLTRKDKMHEKVENYVYKNRDKTSQKIIEKKSKRPARKYQEADVEAMISRISIENSSVKTDKQSSKWLIYLIYIIIIIVALLFVMKNFWWIMPQIS